MSNDDTTPEILNPADKFPVLMIHRNLLSKQEWITLPMLGSPGITTWPRTRWQKAVQLGHIPAYKNPTGQILVKVVDVFAFLDGFNEPVKVEPNPSAKTKAQD